MKVVVLGANGMIGNAMFKVLREKSDLTVWGTLRSAQGSGLFSELESKHLIDDIDVLNLDSLMKLFTTTHPDVVINCVGLTKHRPEASDLLRTLELNATLPHRLARMCEAVGARLIHVSTDCVFLGSKGSYVETDVADAEDSYGKSKSLGEVISVPHVITLRTSTIGHELNTSYGLLDWFLSQRERCKGFSRAVFSGLPSVVFAQVVRDIVLPRSDLHGLYHVSAKAINKLDLLQLIARVYEKKIDIIPDDCLVIDRSLDGTRFSEATGYVAPDWEELIRLMHGRNVKGYA